jgi:truncated hemoglobin YjbI
MPSRDIEEGHLRQARGHIVAARTRIANQTLIVARLRARGLDTRHAEAFLRTMEGTLSAMQGHTELIEGMLASATDSPSCQTR